MMRRLKKLWAYMKLNISLPVKSDLLAFKLLIEFQ
jgi:hypothetical protein